MRRFKPKRKKRADRPIRAESLECVPIKNDLIEESTAENGDLLLTYPVTIRPWLAGLVRRLGGSSERTVLKKLQLDTLGTEVWHLMDDDIRVKDIVRRFAAKHQLPQREAEAAITHFLKDLGQRGLIGLR